MSQKPDGGQAFPRASVSLVGMTLRDYFAAQAMAATIQRLGPIVKVADTGSFALMPDNPAVSEDDGRQIREAVAALAYDYADAMIAEREMQS